MDKKANMNYKTANWAESKQYYDVAISRYYYSLYQKIIYISKMCGFGECQQITGSHFSTIKNFLDEIAKIDKVNNDDYLELENLDNLRKRRNEADYNETRTIEIRTFERTFKNSFDRINNILDNIIIDVRRVG